MPQPTRSNRIPSQQPPQQAQLLAKVPRRTMTPEEQLAALAKVQKQAEQRVKLGRQLFEAAEQRLAGPSGVLEAVRAEQAKLRKQVEDDVAKSLQSYDQWMGQIDEGFTHAIARLDKRLDNLEQAVDGSRGEIENMLAHAGALLEQTQQLLGEAFGEDELESLPTTADGHPPSVPPAPVIDPNAAADASPPDLAGPGGPGVFGRLLDQLRKPQDDGERAA